MGYELCQKIIDLNRRLGYGAFLCLAFLTPCCQRKSDKGLNPDKPEITNYK